MSERYPVPAVGSAQDAAALGVTGAAHMQYRLLSKRGVALLEAQVLGINALDEVRASCKLVSFRAAVKPWNSAGRLESAAPASEPPTEEPRVRKMDSRLVGCRQSVQASREAARGMVPARG